MQDSQMPDPDLLSAAQSTLPPVDAAPMPSAGQLLRQAREAAHMHRASLAGVLKVPAKKIEALENDDWQSLPDLAFTRALASSICRQLKISNLSSGKLLCCSNICLAEPSPETESSVIITTFLAFF